MSDNQENQAPAEAEENEVLRAARESRAQKAAADASEEALKNDVADCFAAFKLPVTKESEILIKLNELSKLLNEGSLKNE